MSDEAPDDIECANHEGDCIVGERIMIQAEKIPKVKRRAHGQHQKSWTKADNAKCWIEKRCRNLRR